jgi:hypothetical protein
MKYVVKKIRQGGTYHNMNFGEDFKTIEKSKLKIHLENGWQIVRPIYPIITYLSDSWSKLTLNQRISIIGIILTILITIIVA